MPIKTMILMLTLLYPLSTFAHPGRTDAYGCHTCRTNCSKWGLSQNEYHCHASKGVEQPKEPVKSSATGVTVPAPEYKKPVVEANNTKPITPKVTSTDPYISTSTKFAPRVTAPLHKSWFQIFFANIF